MVFREQYIGYTWKLIVAFECELYTRTEPFANSSYDNTSLNYIILHTIPGTIYEGTSNIQLNTIAKLIEAELE